MILLAMLIVGGSFWYTYQLVRRVASEERKKVQLWANAIQEKAKLVNYTTKLFQSLSTEERKKAELWVEATKTLASPSTDISFPLKVIEANNTIPIIWTDKDQNIAGYKNLEGQVNFMADTLSKEEVDSLKAHNRQIAETILEDMKVNGYRIKFFYYKDHYQYFYYKDSRLFEEIKQTFTDLQNFFISEVLSNSASTPVIYTTHSKDSVLAHGHISEEILKNPALLQATIEEMSAENPPIEVDLGNGETYFIFYSDSSLLNQLQSYPFIQFFVIGLFILIGYWLFSTSRKSEQNQVWVGMSKETAHQLGTPLSSLMGWIEVLKSMGIEDSITDEMDKDIQRLNVVTDRFSKIGAKPNLKEENVVELIENFISYLKTRSGKKVVFNVDYYKNDNYKSLISSPLFSWVIENLCKNAIDAMGGVGSITINIIQREKTIVIDITDTGKGIPNSKWKTVFQPGYTSKQRGWGLGLSLSKRIIENYHEGKIFVKHSEPGKGTTFRIILKSIV